jgi:hypothetical protein
MAAQQKPGPFPKSVPRSSSPYWTTERLEEALDYIIDQDEGPFVDEVAHYFKAGHPLDDESEYGECQRCGDEYASDGKELVSALAVRRDEAEPGSKWAGLAVTTGNDYSYGGHFQFFPSRAAEWVAERREATKRQQQRVELAEQNPEPRLGLLEGFWPEERLQVARGYADRLLRAGDLVRASMVNYETLPNIEAWQMMKVVASTPTRRVLTDYKGTVWVAVPIEQTSLPAEQQDS